MPKIRLMAERSVDTIPRHIRLYMASMGINQNDLAERLGITQAAVSSMLRKPASITFERLEQIARIFRVPIAALYEQKG